MNKRTLQQRIFVIISNMVNDNAERVRKEWINEYGDEINPLRKNTIYYLRDRFYLNGTVANLPGSGRPRSVRTTEMANYVLHKTHKKAVLD